MKRRNANSSNSQILIRKVEQIIATKKNGNSALPAEVGELLYELQAQNEELKRAQLQSEEMKNKYLELFNLAPVAYFSFDKDFVIKEVNHTAGRLLNRRRFRMVKSPFSSIVSPTYRNVFYTHRLRLLELKKKQTCELKLIKGDGKEFYALLESVPIINENGTLIEIHSTCSDMTERRQIELKKQAKLIQTSVENMLDPFAILRAIKDDNGIITDFIFEYINEAGCQSSRISKEETIGKCLLSMFPDFRTNGLFEEYCRVYETGEPSTLNALYVNPAADESGLKGIYDFRINRLNSGVVVTWRDITEKIRAEEQILREKKRLETLAEIAEIFASVAVDFKTVSDYTVRKLAEAYSDLCVIHIIAEGRDELEAAAYYHSDSSVLRRMEDLYKAHPLLLYEGIIGQVIKLQKPILISEINNYNDIPFAKKEYQKYIDGFGLASFLSVPIMYQEKVIGTLSIFRNRRNDSYTAEDQVMLQNIANKISLALTNFKLFKEKLNEIEERKLAQEALASQQQLLQSVLETIPVGVWIVDKEGNRILGNETARKIWKANDEAGSREQEEYRGWRADSGENIELYRWASEKSLEGETILNEEILIQCLDGSYKTILNSTVPIVKSNGEIQGTIIVNVDITERKNYEIRLQHTLDELERSNRELEQFAYIASHDLQEPLRMVSSYTQLLEKQYKDKLEPRAIEYISFSVQGAKRMQALIVDLLKYARVTTRAQAFEPVDCNYILNEVISDLKMAIEETSTEIFSDPLPEIYADPTQIRQLLQNLIGNAIKFHSQNKPVIFVSARLQKSEWLFSVKDNGIGIDPRHFERIFMLFQRLHEREKYTGTGIGLAVCKKIVERHGGRIWLESELNKGTEMLFTIPVRNQEK